MPFSEIIIIIIKITVDIHRNMYTLGQGPVTDSLQWQRILMIALPSNVCIQLLLN